MSERPRGPARPESATSQKAGEAADQLDQRFVVASGLRRQINKVFPTHWSFLLGEIALYSFIVLLLTGTYLAFFFDPSMQEVEYNGIFTNLRDVPMSRAYESALDINFEVRGGMLARQIHHWAALLFMAAIVAHMLRIFFTGAFRRPRETNWMIGVLLFIIGMAEGFTGYSLPDDLLSGTGLRIMSGIILTIPVLGTWIQWLLFGSDFPGTEIIPRLYLFHVFVMPGLILALIGVHLALVWYQKHTQFPGRRRAEHNVVGTRILPLFATKSLGFFAAVTGVLVLMSGIFQINAIWNYGPYTAAKISAASQPDWYVLWSEGSIRLWPPWEIYLGQFTIPAAFWPTVFLMGAMFTLAATYPGLERKLAKDDAHHNLLQRPRDVPVRTSLGAMALTFFVVLLLSGANDIIAFVFNISLNVTTWMGRIGVLVGPPLAYYVSYRICLGLQRSDRAILEHGIETGIIRRLPDGQYMETEQPLGPSDEHGHAEPLDYQGAPVPKKLNKLGFAGEPVPGSLLVPDPAEETAALSEAESRTGVEVPEQARERRPERAPSNFRRHNE